MQTNLIEINKCSQQLDFTLSIEELVPKFNDAYKKAAPSIEIKGFRKGKVPFDLMKKYFGQSIEMDSIQDIANESFQNEITERNIFPIGQPALVNINYKPNEPLSFSIKFEVRPTIELKEYKGVEVKKYFHTIDDAEFENEIKRLLQTSATHEEAQKVDGDNFIVTVDMHEVDENGNQVPNRKNDNVKINLTEPTTEKEILEVLKVAESQKEYSTAFEHKHNDHSHKVNLKLFVKKIEKIILPEFNDEFVKNITKEKFTEVETFKASMKTDLENYWSEQFEKRFLDDLINEIVSKHEFDVPESLVDGIANGFVDELKNQLGGKQLPKSFDTKKYKESMKPRAIWQAKWFLLREEIIKKENLDLSDDDILKMAETEAARLGIEKETLINFYKTNEQSKENLINEKLFALLRESAKVETVSDLEIKK